MPGIELPAVFLSFDDWWIEEWFMFLSFFAVRNIRTTFYPAFRKNGLTNYWTAEDAARSMTPRRWQMLGKIAAAGHTIGFHTISHVRADTYIAGYGADKFTADEIRAGLDLIESHGIPRPRHFAFPYGFHNEATDALIVNIFSTARAISPDGESCLYNETDLCEKRIFNGYDLKMYDRYMPIIFRLAKEKKAGFFFGHNPKNVAPALGHLCNYCRINGVQFYPMSALEKA